MGGGPTPQTATPASVRHKRRGRPPHPAWGHAQQICKSYSSGDDVADLAVAFDCTDDVLRKILKVNGVPIRRKSAHEVADAVFAPPYPTTQWVSRDPCPRCNTRADIGCEHSGVRLGTLFSTSAAPRQSLDQRAQHITDLNSVVHHRSAK